MKTAFKSLLTAALLMAFAATTVCCQNMQYSRKYRVIAYKYGNNAVTSMSNETEVIPTMYLYIPNSFTPNGDGMNDTFGISGQAIKEFRMQIFNRWGDMIFESTNANQQWDGTFRGQAVSQGVYIYKVSASNNTGRLSKKEGTVTVVL